MEPAALRLPAGNWLDYPHLAYSNSHLYATTNVFSAAGNYQGTVCWRMNLSDMKNRRSVRWSSTRRTSGGRTWRLSYGATTTMYWWQHETSSRGRLYSWPDSGSVSSRTVTVNAWTWGTRDNMRCPGPDGRDFMRRADSRPLAMTVGRGLITVMWHANTRSGRPRVYVRAVQMNQSNFAVTLQRDIWNSTICWAYPSAAVNARGHLGGTIAVGGTGTHARTQAWIVDDLNPNFSTFDNAGLFGSSGGPTRNAWGDYLTCTFHPQLPNTWIGTGMYMNSSAGNNTNQIPQYAHFGRDRDVDNRPDFTPTSLTASSSILYPNFNVTITSTIANQGNNSGSPRCSHRLSSNSTITTSDTLLYSFTLTGLAGATSRSTTRQSRIPLVNMPSSCYLGVMADDAFAINERNEGNNTRSLLRTCRPRQVDFIPTALTSSTSNLNPLRTFTIRSSSAFRLCWR